VLCVLFCKKERKGDKRLLRSEETEIDVFFFFFN